MIRKYLINGRKWEILSLLPAICLDPPCIIHAIITIGILIVRGFDKFGEIFGAGISISGSIF